jgi:hypothetical protein
MPLASEAAAACAHGSQTLHDSIAGKATCLSMKTLDVFEGALHAHDQKVPPIFALSSLGDVWAVGFRARRECSRSRFKIGCRVGLYDWRW